MVKIPEEKEAYLVVGRTGFGNRPIKWPVVIYFHMDRAVIHAVAAEEKAKEIYDTGGLEQWKSWNLTGVPNPFDRNMKIEPFSKTTYYVIEIPIKEPWYDLTVWEDEERTQKMV